MFLSISPGLLYKEKLFSSIRVCATEFLQLQLLSKFYYSKYFSPIDNNLLASLI